VLAGAAAKEVAGHPEPPEVVEAKVSPVQKPADVLAAEQAGKTRRTAAVVQVELDAALKRVAELEKYARDCAARTDEVQQELKNLSEGRAAVKEDATAEATIAEAVELIQQLRGEAGVQLDDNRKAWARVAELEEQLAKAGNGAAIELGQIDLLLLAGELQGRLDVGQTITLTGQL
jgi:DNA repair ATPase RecN